MRSVLPCLGFPVASLLRKKKKTKSPLCEYRYGRGSSREIAQESNRSNKTFQNFSSPNLKNPCENRTVDVSRTAPASGPFKFFAGNSPCTRACKQIKLPRTHHLTLYVEIQTKTTYKPHHSVVLYTSPRKPRRLFPKRFPEREIPSEFNKNTHQQHTRDKSSATTCR